MTETPTEVMNLDEYAASNEDQFISVVWPQITAQLQGMEKALTDLKKYSPPNQSDIYNFVKSEKGQADVTIKAAYDKITELEETIKLLRAKAHERVVEILAPETLPEEKLAELRSTFQNQRTALSGQLDAAKSYASIMGKTELYTALDAVKLPQFARIPGASAVNVPSESAKAREWLKTNRPDIHVSEKGKMSDEAWNAYRTAHK